MRLTLMNFGLDIEASEEERITKELISALSTSPKDGERKIDFEEREKSNENKVFSQIFHDL